MVYNGVNKMNMLAFKGFPRIVNKRGNLHAEGVISGRGEIPGVRSEMFTTPLKRVIFETDNTRFVWAPSEQTIQPDSTA